MKESSGKQLAKKMLIALVCGLVAGFGCILLREHLNSSGQADLWKTINNIFSKILAQKGQQVQLVFSILLDKFLLILYN